LRRLVLSSVLLNDESELIEGIVGNTLEMKTTFERGNAKRYGIRLNRATGEQVLIAYEDGKLDVAGTRMPLALGEKEPLDLHMFLDKSVLEVFANGRTCCTRILKTGGEDVRVPLFAEAPRRRNRNCS